MNDFLRFCLFSDFLFVCCCKFSSFRNDFPKCPVDRQPLSRDKVMISALGEQILRHFNSKLEAQFPLSEWRVKCRIEHDA